MSQPARSAPTRSAGVRRPALPPPLRSIRDRWYRSLQFRVVTTTLILSVTVVTLVGTFLLTRIKAGLLEAKVQTSVTEAAAGVREAQQLANASDLAESPGAAQLIDQIATKIASRAGTPALYDVLVLASPGTVAVPPLASGSVQESSVPPALSNTVRSDQRLAWAYTNIQTADGAKTPGIAVGAPLVVPNVGSYEVYYLFTTSNEQRTLDLVQRGIALAGFVLILLLALIAWFVTRSVVQPVRVAADVAQRLAAGRLEERMQVRGEDELARLANAFNSMAANIKGQIRQLEDLSRVQRRFVADVSHELRTPLTTIRMASDVIYENKEDFDPATERATELMAEQLDRFEDLLTELLEISRFDSGQAMLDADAVDLRDVTRRVVTSALPLAEAKGTAVLIEESAEPCSAEVDALRVERVLRNLVVNAIEHGEGRPITVTVAVDEASVAVSVRDHGVGLRPGESSLVFNRFWRSDPSRARTTGGTGLGLSIALEDARLHGGWLEAWGEPGHGSVFRLTLPRRVGEVLQSSPLPLEPVELIAAREATLEVGDPYRTTRSQ